MDKRKLISWILQVIYFVLCIVEIVFCIIYQGNYDTEFGKTCAHIALYLISVLFLVPAMPLSFVLNIFILLKPKDGGIQSIKWLVWTIISPILYVCLWGVACCVFVTTTGGV